MHFPTSRCSGKTGFSETRTTVWFLGLVKAGLNKEFAVKKTATDARHLSVPKELPFKFVNLTYLLQFFSNLH